MNWIHFIFKQYVTDIYFINYISCTCLHAHRSSPFQSPAFSMVRSKKILVSAGNGLPPRCALGSIDIMDWNFLRWWEKSQGQPPFGCIKSCESWGKVPSLGDFYGTLVGKYTSVYGPHGGLMIYIPSLKLTFSPLKIDGWKMTCPFLPFLIFRGISFQFQGGQWHIRYLHSQWK